MTRCECPSCAISRSLREIHAAREEQCNQSEELGMSHAYLVDEVTAVVALPWWRSGRARLREALRVAAA